MAYLHNDKDPNSITNAKLETLTIDNAGNIWIGTLGGGMEKFDPAGNTFTHFLHKKNDPGSLSSDTVTAILQDHLGNLWVGTSVGLDRYDNKTGKFIHYLHTAKDPQSLSGTHVRVLYEDREGRLWVGCGSPFPNEESWKDEGGLNLFDRKTGKFTRYLHDPSDSSSIVNNKVRALLEDSKGNFWVGTAGDGLQTLNRQTGKFTHYYYDSTHPEKLSRGPLYKGLAFDQVKFIKEDVKGKIWIGTYAEGIVEYDPATKKVTHYGYILQPGKVIKADTLSGFKMMTLVQFSFKGRFHMDWHVITNGSLYKIDFSKNVILPYNKIVNGDSFYKSGDSTVWIGTDRGLIRRDEKTGKQKIFMHDPNNPNSLSSNQVYDIKPGKPEIYGLEHLVVVLKVSILQRGNFDIISMIVHIF